MKRKILIVAAGACAMAAPSLVIDMLVGSAYAQEAAAATPAPAVIEMPPPSGAVLAPTASTISAPAPNEAVAKPAADRHADPAGRLKTASVRPGGKNSTDRASSDSFFSGLETNSSHGPTNINSDTMSFDYKKNMVVFSGHVHAAQAGNELSSNTLHVLLNKRNEIEQMIADGNVRMSQGQRWTTSDHAVLDETRHTLVLTGSPVAHDGKDQIAGTKITVFLQTNTSEVTNPKAVIFPRESKRPNNSEEEPSAVPDRTDAND